MENKCNSHAIDVVIPWVDGNDPLHKEKMKHFLLDDRQLTKSLFRTRFDQVNEIEFAIRSIIKFAPFVRKIFLVTDNQIPNFFKENKKKKGFEKVVLVDHKEIFKGYEQYLPTFNCLAIETMITNIPDLSENFIYSNDDLFLMKETVSADFFINGQPILRGKWTKFDSDIWFKKLYSKLLVFFGKKGKDKRYGYKRGQQNIARKLGLKKYYKFDHTPAPLRKSTIVDFFKSNPDMELLNTCHRFRHYKQFTLQGMANHIEIQNNTCVLKNDYQLCYLQSFKKPLLWYKLKLALCKRNAQKLFLCMQSLDQCPPEKLKFLVNWTEKLLK